MHEVGVARALIETAERSAAQAGLRRVRRVNVELGAAAGLAPAALALALEVVARGTAVEGDEVTFSGPGAAAAGHDEREHAHDHPLDADALGVRLTWIDGE
jgi:hydrogenase nickel incorporation protein HypA/HybF